MGPKKNSATPKSKSNTRETRSKSSAKTEPIIAEVKMSKTRSRSKIVEKKVSTPKTQQIEQKPKKVVIKNEMKRNSSQKSTDKKIEKLVEKKVVKVKTEVVPIVKEEEKTVTDYSMAEEETMNLVDFSNMLEQKFNLREEPLATEVVKISHSFTPRSPGKDRIKASEEAYKKLR